MGGADSGSVRETLARARLRELRQAFGYAPLSSST